MRLGFGFVLLTAAAWAQTGEETAQRWFRVSWAPPTDSAVSTLKESVFNSSPYRVTNVRLEVEGVDGNNHLVGRMQAWAVGGILPAQRRGVDSTSPRSTY